MKVVFLDFDGVLNSAEFMRRDPGPFDRLDPLAVARLGSIVARSGARIVVTSSWRLSRSMRTIEGLLAAHGFSEGIESCTPDLSGAIFMADWSLTRSTEILTWLSCAPVPVERFVVLDDGDLEDLTPHQVRTTFERGLLDEHVEQAIAMLADDSPSRDG